MAEKAKEKDKSKLILISVVSGVVAVLAVVILIWVLVTGGEKKGRGPGGSVASEQLKGLNPVFGQIYALESFVVNLSDPGGKRYLKTKIELEFMRDGFQDELVLKLPQLRDMILLILSSKTLEDIQGIDGKIALRNELITRINQILQTVKIRNLYFTEFVVQ